MKKKKKILFLTILLGFILGLSITTISILNSKNKIDTKNIENIARKYLNDNDIHCDSYCEVTSKELNQSGYLKDNNNDLKISFTNYNGDLEANIYQLSSLENTTVSGYQAEISESKEPNTNASITYTDNSVEITGENSYAGFNYLISGLKKEQLYIATANITLENLQGSGAYISASDSYSDTLSTSKTDTLKMVFKTSNTDKMNILVFLGFNNRKAQGKLTINNLTLKEADNDVKIFTSSNNLIKSIYWTSDLTKNNIQTAKLNEYVEKLENVYNAYADLVGHTSRSEELLYPINKNTIYIFNTNDTEYYMAAAYASQRIQMDRNYIEQFEANAIKNDDIYWNVLHEMGHVFTINQLSNDDVKSNLNITFDREPFAQQLPFYAMNKLGYTVSGNYNFATADTTYNYNELINVLETKYKNKTPIYDEYSGYLPYLLMQNRFNDTIEKVDWEAWKNTFKWMNDFDTQISNGLSLDSDGSKFLWFIKKLDDYSAENIRNHFDDNDLTNFFKRYKSSYNPITNIIINDNNISKSNIFNLTVTPTNYKNNDIIIYSTDNSNVTINEFGVITALNGSLSNVNVTVKSYLNSAASSSKTLNVKESNINVEVPNLYKGINNYRNLKMTLNNIKSNSNIKVTVNQNDEDKTSLFNPSLINRNIDPETSNGTANLIFNTKRLEEVGNYNLNIYVNGTLFKTISFNVTEPEYTMISTPEQLQNIQDNLSGVYKLANDINLTNYDFTMIGDPSNNLEKNFSGLLDGGGYSIIGLNLNSNADIGLFGGINGGTIKNLNIKAAKIISNNSKDSDVGILASALYNDSYVYNVSTSGFIQANIGNIGGLVGIIINGRNNAPTIENSYNSADLISKQTTSTISIGGIVGQYRSTILDNNSILKNVFNTGNITVNDNSNIAIKVGGILGKYSAYLNETLHIINAYNVGKININRSTTATSVIEGGIIAFECSSSRQDKYILLENAYSLSDVYNSSASACTTLTNSAKKTINEMKEQTTYKNYDFNNTWEILNNTLPTLKNNKYYYTSSINVLDEEINLINNKEYNILDYFSLDPSNVTNAKLTYEVSQIGNNGKVVEMSEQGKIKTLKVGKAAITIDANDGSHLTKEITINVIEPSMEIESKTINPDTIYNNSSGTVTLNLKTKQINNDENLTVKILNNDEDVTSKFTISGNKVNENKATIVITTPSDIAINQDETYTVEISNENVKVTDTFQIKKFIYVNEIQVNKTNFNMIVGAKEDLNVSVLPQEANNKELEIENLNDNVATYNESEHQIEAKNPGSTMITFKAKDGSNVIKKINVEVGQFKLNLKATIDDENYSNGKITNKPVKITLIAENIEEENITYKYSTDNKISWQDYINGQSFENIDETLYFKAIDSEGRESNIVNIHINSDTKSPKLMISYKKYQEELSSAGDYIGTLLNTQENTFDSRISLYLQANETSGTLKYQLYDNKDNKLQDKTVTEENISCNNCNTLNLLKNIKYRLEVQATDEAGNKTEQTYYLTIDNHLYNLSVSINNGIYKGGGTYENQNTFKDTLNTQKEKSKFIVEPNEYYSYNGAIITCSNDQITSEYDKGDLIFTNYSAIDEDIECTVTFQEENYEIKIETDNHGTIEGIKDNKIKQKHSDIKKYNLTLNKGYIYKSFICNNANVLYNKEENSVTISEVKANATCTYETQKQENNIPKIKRLDPIINNDEDNIYKQNTWTNNKVKALIEAQDDDAGVGIKEIWYKTSENDKWNLYTEDLEFENINATIYFKAIDYSDNESEVQQIIVKSDTIAPTTPKITSLIDGTKDNYTSDTFTNQKINILLNSIDDLSGIAKYQYKIENNFDSESQVSKAKLIGDNSNEWLDIEDNKITLQDIDNTVSFRALDNAGNISEVNVIKINSDTTQIDQNVTDTSDNNSEEEVKEPNPNTGIYSLVIVIVILFGSISLLVYLHKKNIFQKF